MANNLDVLDAAAATQTLKTTDTAGVHTPHHNVDSSALPAGAATSAKQDTQITAEQAILAKLLAAPATEAKQDTQITAEQAMLATLGATNGAAVVTDANGTLQQYLRGLVTLWLAGLKAGSAIIGKVGIDQTTPGTTDLVSVATAQGAGATIGAAADAAVITDANGTLSGKLRGLIALWLAGLKAGEAHIGEVGGSSKTVTPTHTVDTAVYAAGDTVGTIIEIANAFRASGKESILQSIHILDRSNQKPTGNLLFFNASPAAATTTDNAAFVYSTDDQKEVARITIAASDYTTINSKAVANIRNIGAQVYATTGTSLFLVFVTDGAPDFVAGTDFQVAYSFLRD